MYGLAIPPPRSRNGVTVARGENGIILVVMLAMVVPLLLLAAAATMTLEGRNRRLMAEIAEERALICAESGIDHAILLANSSLLGPTETITVLLDAHHKFLLVSKHLGSDGEDNDGDSLIDEADEDYHELTITGNYGAHERKLRAYIGPAFQPAAIQAALSLNNPTLYFKAEDIDEVNGRDRTLAGNAGSAPDLPAISLLTPGSLNTLFVETESSDLAKIRGVGPVPSAANSATDPQLALEILTAFNSATQILRQGSYRTVFLGNSALDDYRVIFVNGDLSIDHAGRGAGLLFVTGSLHARENFKFDGLLIVLGDLILEGGSVIQGAVIQGSSATRCLLRQDVRIQYCSEALDKVSAMLTGKFIALRSWKEL